MIETILALIATFTAYMDGYNAAHVLPLQAVMFIGFMFWVALPLMLWGRRLGGESIRSCTGQKKPPRGRPWWSGEGSQCASPRSRTTA